MLDAPRLGAPRQIAHLRLRNHRLDGDPLPDVEAVAAWLGVVQAQDYPLARWSIGQRSAGVTPADVDAALAAGRVIRTHVLRDTWHLVAARDVRWLLELSRARVHARNATMYRRLGLESDVLARTDDCLARALEGRQLSRSAVAAALAEQGVPTDGLRLAYIIMHAELEGLIGSGALEGRQHTYALLDERIPRTRSLPREDALAELARRFFTSHGPATAKDMAWWASLTVAEARRAAKHAGLDCRTVDGRTYFAGSEPPPLTARGAEAHLLQGFDEYIVGYSESRDVIELEGTRALSRDPSWLHAIVVCGQVVGQWRRPADAEVVEVRFGRALSEGEAAIVDGAIARYATFLGRQLSWRPAAIDASAQRPRPQSG